MTRPANPFGNLLPKEPRIEEALTRWKDPASDSDKIECRERISYCRARLLEWTPFFGHLTLKLRVTVTTSIPTAAVTPDAQMFVNPHFAKALTDAELSGLICHEVMHPAYMCFQRRGDRDMKLWNVAHDYAINWIIWEMTGKRTNPNDFTSVVLPPGGLLSERFVQKNSDGEVCGYLSAEEIYDILLEEGGTGTGEGDGEDDGNGPGYGNDIRPDLSDNSDPTDVERRAQEDYWKAAILEAAEVNNNSRCRGNIPGNLLKLIEEIKDPKVDWPIILGRWVGENGKKTDYTYRRPSRRSESAGAILPSLKKHGVADVVVLWDTSGSMNGREQDILSEVIGICNDLSMTLRVICCDTGVTSDTSNVQDWDQLKDQIKGGGGSDYRPAFSLMEEEGWDGVLVCFTDGAILVPDMPPTQVKGVLWVIGEGEAPPTAAWGDVLEVGADGKVSVTRRAAA